MLADRLVDPETKLVIGHRGAPAGAPENTFPSFDLALAQGAAALELDIRLTADAVPVVLHDARLDRTTSGTGPARGIRAARLCELDAGARFRSAPGDFPWRDRGVTVPTLRAVLDRYRDVPLLIELKEVDAQAAVRSALLDAGAQDRVVVAAFDWRALALFRSGPFLVGASGRDILRLKAASLLGLRPTDRAARAYAVPYRYRDRIVVPTASFLRAARRLGAAAHVWTVDDPKLARDLWEAGASGVITNDPAAMVRELEQGSRSAKPAP